MDGKTLKNLVFDFVQQGLTRTEPNTAMARTPFPVVLPATGQTCPLDSSLLTNAGIHALPDAQDDSTAFDAQAQKPDTLPLDASK